MLDIASNSQYKNISQLSHVVEERLINGSVSYC